MDQLCIGPVDQVSALSLYRNQLGPAEFFQVKAKRRVRDAQLFHNLPWGEPEISALHDEPKDIQAGLLAESEEGDDGLLIVHFSNYMEIL